MLFYDNQRSLKFLLHIHADRNCVCMCVSRVCACARVCKVKLDFQRVPEDKGEEIHETLNLVRSGFVWITGKWSSTGFGGSNSAHINE